MAAAMARSPCGGLSPPLPAHGIMASSTRAAHPPRLCQLRIRASSDAEQALNSNPLFTSQFRGVLQQSLARQGDDALTGRNAVRPEPRASATVEVLGVALHQSKRTLAQLTAWRDQLDRQIAVQQKQIERIDFAYNKSKSDEAYMNTLKELLHGDL